MDAIYTSSLLLPPNDIDLSNRLKPSAFFNLIQSTASAHAERLNLGFRGLQAAGLFWVLSWVKLEIDDYPAYQDTITITTWPHRRYRLYSIRDFLFLDHNGQVFCRGRSAWLPVNAGTQRIASLDRLPRPVPYFEGRSALPDLPEKLHIPEQAEAVYHRHIRYTDLDLNQHVNNARYVEFLLDSYPLEFHSQHSLRSLTFSFQAEAKYSDQLTICRAADPQSGNLHHVYARRRGDERIIFQAMAEWSADSLA